MSTDGAFRQQSLSGRTARPLIVGFGVTGRSLARYLAPATVVDDRPAPDAAATAETLAATLHPAPTASELVALVADASIVVVSPGVPISHPVFALAAQVGVPVRSELELGWQALADRGESAPRLAAVTGTNGKTTVTTEIVAMLGAARQKVDAAGNIGTPLVDLADAPLDWIVAEVSSFQLAATEGWRPQVSCWLNFSADHLDWHPDLDDYAASKARIWANQAAGDTAVINLDDPVVTAHAAAIDPAVRRVGFSLSGRGDVTVADGRLVAFGEAVMEIGELARSLPHDVANALAALGVALTAGATTSACAEALATSPLLPHRVALVAERGGVGWYDDSKATTPASVLAAVAGFGSVVLIAGGRNKGLDLTPLGDAVPPVRAAIAIGEAAPEVEDALRDSAIEVRRAGDMATAITHADALARPGDAVILSPGCASFDWYRSYAERGDDFARLVHALPAPDDEGVQP